MDADGGVVEVLPEYGLGGARFGGGEAAGWGHLVRVCAEAVPAYAGMTFLKRCFQTAFLPVLPAVP